MIFIHLLRGVTWAMRFVFMLPKGFYCAAMLESLCSTTPHLGSQLSLKSGILNMACLVPLYSTQDGHGVLVGYMEICPGFSQQTYCSTPRCVSSDFEQVTNLSFNFSI